ncbi:hypothetical protein ROHU_013399 [Labeo rohita]|uniref:RNase H type-1 domain-containing protein n=1 Tax=Labeo rohita TaxID=84645 RepID=A0A498L4U2_LABRO|nr:hypothetical protein ROHU_013399 [Labeo rohita]
MGGVQRNASIAVLADDNKIAVTDSDKAEMLVETFVKAHIGIEGNECVDQLAKKTLEHAQVELQITIN